MKNKLFLIKESTIMLFFDIICWLLRCDTWANLRTGSKHSINIAMRTLKTGNISLTDKEIAFYKSEIEKLRKHKADIEL